MKQIREEVAEALVAANAVVFTPRHPITFKSGIVSPVYVDNRRLPYHPTEWHIVMKHLHRVIDALDLPLDVIAGVATGGIPHSAVVAYNMRKPSVFVRKEDKAHGTGSRIEGGDVSDCRVLLIEDMITTGGSSLSSVAALREAGAIVQDCMAIISYGFSESVEAFTEMGVRLHTLTHFAHAVQAAQQQGMLDKDDIQLVMDWLDDPHNWAKRQGIQ
jgi:orotate phosphoribosyltransferase